MLRKRMYFCPYFDTIIKKIKQNIVETKPINKSRSYR